MSDTVEPAPAAPAPSTPPKPPPTAPPKTGWVRWLIIAAILLLVGGAFARMLTTAGDPMDQAREALAQQAEVEVKAEAGKSAKAKARGAYQRCARVCVLEAWTPLERCVGKAGKAKAAAAQDACWKTHGGGVDGCLGACMGTSKSYAGVELEPMVAEMLSSISRDEARRLVGASAPAAEKKAEIGGVMVSRGDVEAAPPTSVESLLPYLTEGSLFLLVGFGLGMLTRMLFKVLLIVLVLFLAGVMFLETKEFVTVAWGPMLDWVRTGVLNLSANESITDFVATKIPSAGSLGVGYFLGIRRR